AEVLAEGKEVVFEGRTGGTIGGCDEGLEAGCAAVGGVTGERFGELGAAEVFGEEGVVDCAREPSVVEGRGHVEKCAGGGGDADAVLPGQVVAVKGGAVGFDACGAAVAGDRDVEAAGP